MTNSVDETQHPTLNRKERDLGWATQRQGKGTQLSNLPFDPELTPGARNAVKVCLRVQPSEKVTVITDEATKEIAASIALAAGRS